MKHPSLCCPSIWLTSANHLAHVANESASVQIIAHDRLPYYGTAWVEWWLECRPNSFLWKWRAWCWQRPRHRDLGSICWPVPDRHRLRGPDSRKKIARHNISRIFKIAFFRGSYSQKKVGKRDQLDGCKGNTIHRAESMKQPWKSRQRRKVGNVTESRAIMPFIVCE